MHDKNSFSLLSMPSFPLCLQPCFSKFICQGFVLLCTFFCSGAPTGFAVECLVGLFLSDSMNCIQHLVANDPQQNPVLVENVSWDIRSLVAGTGSILREGEGSRLSRPFAVFGSFDVRLFYCLCLGALPACMSVHCHLCSCWCLQRP